MFDKRLQYGLDLAKYTPVAFLLKGSMPFDQKNLWLFKIQTAPSFLQSSTIFPTPAQQAGGRRSEGRKFASQCYCWGWLGRRRVKAAPVTDVVSTRGQASRSIYAYLAAAVAHFQDDWCCCCVWWWEAGCSCCSCCRAFAELNFCRYRVPGQRYQFSLAILREL